MGTFSKDSLALLRSRIDVVEVLSPYLKLERNGAGYKALCPFHEEKTPSFVIQKGESHYHCFGCGAHGDAIQFLMTHLKMSFMEAVESLAERFHIRLEEGAQEEAPKGTPKSFLREVLLKASQFYHVYLLHTLEGHNALDYLYHRGIDLEFIRRFELGLAPKSSQIFLKAMGEYKISQSVLEEVGLISKGKDFFVDRITFPIRDAIGSIIGFSARKYKLETFGGKYINSPETALFKKSKVLFGLSFSRKTITKERKAILVEGQIDALRLIHAGFDWTVASQGTAFGEEMVKELTHLGVRQVYVAFDGDKAGKEASMKVGHLFQKEGVDVNVVELPSQSDPDELLREQGPQEWSRLLEKSEDYLTFLVKQMSLTLNSESPAGKNELVQTIAKRIREWDHPLMIHEALRKLARITETPESMIEGYGHQVPQIHIKRDASVTFSQIDPDRILDADLLRWLFLMGETMPRLIEIAKTYLEPRHFRTSSARILYEKYMKAAQEGTASDLLSLAIDLDKPEEQLFLAEMLHKKVNRDRVIPLFIDTIQKILERSWMREREEIKLKIYSGKCTEEEVLQLARQFDELKRQRPQVIDELKS